MDTIPVRLIVLILGMIVASLAFVGLIMTLFFWWLFSGSVYL